MMQLLDWTYDKAINGLPGVDSAEELASNYFEKLGDIEKAIKTLIRWQKVKCTTSGFVSGLPGLPAILTKINQRVGFRLVTKFGEKGWWYSRGDF